MAFYILCDAREAKYEASGRVASSVRAQRCGFVHTRDASITIHMGTFWSSGMQGMPMCYRAQTF